MKVVVTSGYYDPLHVGHLELLKCAKAMGDYLIVIVNSDKQAELKKGKPFMPEAERLALVKAIRYVDHAIISMDDDRTVCKTLEMLHPAIFAKGGDSTLENIPEREVCRRLGIEIIVGVGGGKIQSSSWLLEKSKSLDNSFVAPEKRGAI